MQTSPALSYMRNRIETATPEQLTLMLLEGAHRFSVLAQHCLVERDYANGNTYLQRCQMIVEELMMSLNLEVGPVAHNLYKIYEFLHHRLVQANLRKDSELLPEITEYLSELRECWHSAMTQQNGGQGCG